MNAITNFFTGSKEQYFRIDGKVDFHIDPIVTKGKLPFHSASLSIKAYKTTDKNVMLPLKIKWFRYTADRHYEIPELSDSEFYDFSAMDIGNEVKCYIKVKGNFEGMKGAANITFGPIRFDPSIRPPLESVLLSGFSKFNVMVEEDEPQNIENSEPISVFISPN